MHNEMVKAYLQSMTAGLEEWRIKRRDMEEWMRHRQLPPDLQERVRPFEQYKWLTTRGVNAESILRSLPQHLGLEIQRHLCLNLVGRSYGHHVNENVFRSKNAYSFFWMNSRKLRPVTSNTLTVRTGSQSGGLERLHWLNTTSVLSRCDAKNDDSDFKFGMFADALTSEVASSPSIAKYIYCLR